MQFLSSINTRYLAVAALIIVGAWYFSPITTDSGYARTLKQLQPKPNHPAIVAFNHDGSRLAIANRVSKDIRIYAIPSYELIRTFGKPGEVHTIAFAPDGKTLAVGSGFSRLTENRNSIRLWNTDTGDAIWEPGGFVPGTGAENDVLALAYSPGGNELLASLNSIHAQRNCCYEFLIDLQKKTTKGFATSLSYSVAYSPSGDRIVTGGFEGMRMWLPTGEGPVWEHSVKKGNQPNDFGVVHGVSFSPDGSELLSSSEGRVAIHSAVDGKQVGVLPIEQDKYRENLVAAYSPDGRYILAASDRLFIFDARSKRLLEESELPRRAFSISFDSKGRMFAIGTNSGYVVIKEFVAM